MNIQTKLVSSFGVIIFFIVIIAYIGYIGANDAFQKYEKITDQTAQELALLGKIETLGQKMQVEAISHFVYAKTSGELDNEDYEEFLESNEDIDSTIRQLASLETDDKELREDTIKDITRIKEKLFRTSTALINAINQNAEGHTIYSLKEELELAEEDFEEIIEEKIQQERAELKKRGEIADLTVYNINNYFIITSMIVLIGSTGFGVFVSRKFSNSIKSIREITNEITRGNLKNRIKIKGNDEISDLSSDINSMIISLIDQKEDIQKNERLVAIGELAARLAHDIRNPLSIIQVSLENWRSTSEGKNIDEKQFERVERAISRISHQIQDVLGYVKKEPLRFEEVHISEIIADALDSLKIPNQTYVEISKKDFQLKCDKKRLSVAIANIIFNSVQAISGEGKIKIDLEKNNENTIITIEDSGKGIDANNIEKVFEPLYTTKQHGTGLGLASVKSIIQDHRGTINVNNNPTRFIIKLPNKQRIAVKNTS